MGTTGYGTIFMSYKYLHKEVPWMQKEIFRKELIGLMFNHEIKKIISLLQA